MKPTKAILFLAVCLVLSTAVAAQTVKSAEHWVENGPIRLYVWEKYVETPKDAPDIVQLRKLV